MKPQAVYILDTLYCLLHPFGESGNEYLDFSTEYLDEKQNHQIAINRLLDILPVLSFMKPQAVYILDTLYCVLHSFGESPLIIVNAAPPGLSPSHPRVSVYQQGVTLAPLHPACVGTVYPQAHPVAFYLQQRKGLVCRQDQDQWLSPYSVPRGCFCFERHRQGRCSDIVLYGHESQAAVGIAVKVLAGAVPVVDDHLHKAMQAVLCGDLQRQLKVIRMKGIGPEVCFGKVILPVAVIIYKGKGMPQRAIGAIEAQGIFCHEPITKTKDACCLSEVLQMLRYGNVLLLLSLPALLTGSKQ